MLALDSVSRHFGELTAVDAVSFPVPRGELTGFVGANGAGKTTTMRMIMGVLAPSAGHITWDGEPVTLAARKAFGYMPEERGLYPKQKVSEQLQYLARLRGLSSADAKRDVEDLLARLGLQDRMTSKLEELSLGNQQRVQIAASLLGRPELLVLDEPFSGLDPIAVDAMVEMLREATGRGTAVLFSSHQLDLVERICDRLVVLAAGKVAASGSVAELRAAGEHRHRLVVETAGTDADWPASVPGVRIHGHSGGAFELVLADDAAGQAVLAEALRRGTVREFRPIVPTVTDMYREIVA